MVRLGAVVPLRTRRDEDVPFSLYLCGTGQTKPRRAGVAGFAAQELPPPQGDIAQLCSESARHCKALRMQSRRRDGVAPGAQDGTEGLVLHRSPQ